VTLAVKGAFEVMGITIQLPTLSLSPKSFADVPQAILDFIAKHAEALFADLLKPDVWLKAIANAIVEGVENIARGLRDHFQQSAEQIARGLHDTLNYTAEQSAQALQSIQESADNVGRALSSIGVPVGEITTALKTVGYAPEAIGGALKALGQAPDDARKLLEAAGVPAAVVASAINSVFGAVLGGGVFVKIPTPDVFIKVPHLKTPHIKGPHLKSPF
jgi:ABC-type transporter Mla subunit MlaD